VSWPFDQLLDAWRTVRADRLFEPGEPPARAWAGGGDLEALPAKALGLAIAQIGCGEAGGNNCGPDVERFIAPAKAPQNWCAAFVGWCYEQTAQELGVALPFKRSLGAKRLGENIAALGRKFTDPAEAKPGDVMVFDRGAKGSWMGHIAMVEKVDPDAPFVVHTVEGNHGPKVIRLIRTPGADRFAWFGSLRRS
jgi:hypothetical protein